MISYQDLSKWLDMSSLFSLLDSFSCVRVGALDVTSNCKKLCKFTSNQTQLNAQCKSSMQLCMALIGLKRMFPLKQSNVDGWSSNNLLFGSQFEENSYKSENETQKHLGFFSRCYKVKKKVLAKVQFCQNLAPQRNTNHHHNKSIVLTFDLLNLTLLGSLRVMIMFKMNRFKFIDSLRSVQTLITL